MFAFMFPLCDIQSLYVGIFFYGNGIPFFQSMPHGLEFLLPRHDSSLLMRGERLQRVKAMEPNLGPKLKKKHNLKFKRYICFKLKDIYVLKLKITHFKRKKK